MRRDRLRINKATGLKQIKEDLRATLKEHHLRKHAALEDAADYIYIKSTEIVPLETGELQDSIQVDVSYSPRYPGIIVTATALNPKTGYDYAYIQEVEETYHHAPGRQAHYLEEPFREAVQRFYKEMGWK